MLLEYFLENITSSRRYQFLILEICCFIHKCKKDGRCTSSALFVAETNGLFDISIPSQMQLCEPEKLQLESLHSDFKKRPSLVLLFTIKTWPFFLDIEK